MSISIVQDFLISFSPKFYSNVLKNITQSHELYPKAKDGRGIAFEQTVKWGKAEKDFIDSLNAKPNQAYVINYLVCLKYEIFK